MASWKQVLMWTFKKNEIKISILKEILIDLMFIYSYKIDKAHKAWTRDF